MNHLVIPVVALLTGMMVMVSGCETSLQSTEFEITVRSGFDRPQALLFRDDHLVVGNSGYRASGWQEGSISILDRHTKETVYEQPTAAFNPQQIRALGRWNIVVETGKYDFTDFENPLSLPPFGIELIEHGPMDSPVNHFIELPNQFEENPISAPVDIATIDDISIITSGLFDVVWRIEWSSVERGEVTAIDVLPLDSELRTGLGSITTWNDQFVILDFNSDRLYLLDRSARTVQCSVHFGDNPDLMEGLQTPVIIGNTLYATFAFSGHIRGIDLTTLADECMPSISTLDVVLGQVPNDMDMVGNELWVTQSGENHILRLSMESPGDATVIVLPVSSNPWHFNAHETASIGAVSLWNLDAVGLIDLSLLTVR